MANGLLIGNNSQYISAYASNPYMTNDLFSADDFMSALTFGASIPNIDFSNFFSPDIMSNDFLLNLVTGIQANPNWQSGWYNTKTNLAQLKDVYDPELSGKLAAQAENNARRTRTIGWCAKGTNDALEQSGIVKKGSTRVEAAYQEADRLENLDNFKEITVEKSDLSNLPAGCVIVWDRGTGKGLSNQYGHIAITLGNGKEASDHVANLSNYNSQFRVFVPVAQKSIDQKA